jgi:hypothetical protein
MTLERSSLRVSMSLLVLTPLLSVILVSGGRAQVQKVPTGVILVKEAWASASDATTPVPEGGEVTNTDYINPYFQLTLPLSQGWVKKYDGPPPSDTGYYVLAQLQPRDTVGGGVHGSMVVTAADLFFSPTGARSALQFVNFSRTHLQADYKVARAPTPLTLSGHRFVRFDYSSAVAGLHWSVLATEIRCHIVQFVFTSRDVRLLSELLEVAARMKLSGQAGEPAVCIKDYARPENVLERVDPILTGHRFNPIPVRVIIGKQGRIEHIHFLSAFPEQSSAITEALRQWKFKPYLRDGQPVEVETGILFGHAPEVAQDESVSFKRR